MPRVIKSKNELEEIVVRHLRARAASAGVTSVIVTPMSAATGGWTVKRSRTDRHRAACASLAYTEFFRCCRRNLCWVADAKEEAREPLGSGRTCAKVWRMEEAMVAKLKVVRIGKSLGVVFPDEISNALKVEAGDTLFVTKAPGGYRLTAGNAAFAPQMDRADAIMSRRRKALRNLAK